MRARLPLRRRRRSTTTKLPRGKVSLIGYTPTGATQSVSVYVAILQKSRCRLPPDTFELLYRHQARYALSVRSVQARHERRAVADRESVELLWQSSNNLVKYLTFKDGVASFYIEKAESEDKDDKEKPDAVTPGNALSLQHAMPQAISFGAGIYGSLRPILRPMP